MADFPLLKLLIISGLTLGLFAVGLRLQIDDFARLFRSPRVALNGLLMQWLLLPALAILAILIWPLPEAWVLGVAILAASPGGPLSNLATHIGNGNGALSVSLTAASTVLAPITLPLFVGIMLGIASVSAESLSLPFAKIIERLIETLILPVAVGMLVRRFIPGVADRLGTPLKWLSVGLFLVMFVHANVTYWERFAAGISQLLPIAALIMIGIAFGAEWLGRGQGFRPQDRMTLGLEVGIQNITTGLFLGEVVLKQPEITVFNLIYGALIPVYVLAMILHYRGINRAHRGNN